MVISVVVAQVEVLPGYILYPEWEAPGDLPWEERQTSPLQKACKGKNNPRNGLQEIVARNKAWWLWGEEDKPGTSTWVSVLKQLFYW